MFVILLFKNSFVPLFIIVFERAFLRDDFMKAQVELQQGAIKFAHILGISLEKQLDDAEQRAFEDDVLLIVYPCEFLHFSIIKLRDNPS